MTAKPGPGAFDRLFAKGEAGCVATVGTFDGVHLGHQRVVERVVERAGATNRRAVLVTFDPHPLTVVRPDKDPKLLTTASEKKEALAGTGLHAAVFIRFTRELSRWSPERFVREVLVDGLGVKELVAGYDHGFGRNRAGDAETLRRAGEALGFSVEVVAPLATEAPNAGSESPTRDTPVSSSLVRRAVARGALDEAEISLGRPYSISGRVVPGDGRGRKLGFPTANLDIVPEKLLPPAGIYAVRAFVPEGGFMGALHIGPRPTFAGALPSVEVHLLDYPGDELYGARLRVDPTARIRDVRAFADARELAVAIAGDVDAVREMLAGR